MNSARSLFAMLKADFLERTRRTGFLATLCLVFYLGYAVNSGQILIKLETYRGLYNSAWVGSLMALVITFFLGVAGFFLVKNTIERDEQTGVGQILATTPLSRVQYLLGKWLSNFSVLAALVGILMVSAIFMQLFYREVAEVQLWSLLAPFLFLALPMMALVSAFAIFFESVAWLKGGFGNLVYFFVFLGMFTVGIFMPNAPWLDVSGFTLIGTSMREAARGAFPTYGDSFVLSMISDQPLQTFVWHGLDWTTGLILQRLAWLIVSVGIVLFGALFFNRFDPSRRSISKRKKKGMDEIPEQEVGEKSDSELPIPQLSRMEQGSQFHFNLLGLIRLECALLVKGLKWYWIAGLAVFWIGSAVDPSANLRSIWYMLVSIWPVLLWSKLGVREVQNQTEQLIYSSAYPWLRPFFATWLAGVFVTAMAFSAALIGRLVYGESLSLLPWGLSVLFIPTLALALGDWGRTSKVFQFVYPILWYLGPFNRENGVVVIDYLGIHEMAPVNATPLLFAGFLGLLFLAALLGRKKQLVQ